MQEAITLAQLAFALFKRGPKSKKIFTRLRRELGIVTSRRPFRRSKGPFSRQNPSLDHAQAGDLGILWLFL